MAESNPYSRTSDPAHGRFALRPGTRAVLKAVLNYPLPVGLKDVVPGGQFGGAGGAQEVIFPKGF